MLRRSFIKSVFSNLVLLLVPRWMRGQALNASPGASATLNEIAQVVLPSSLGSGQMQQVAASFQRWIHDYPAGADAGYGYGFPHPRVLGPTPAAHYAGQLSQMDAAAAAKGAAFAMLSNADKRAVVEDALAQAGISAVPAHPTGQHVATDLMSFFYNSSSGEDFCYNAAIRRDSCRGLSNSGERPKALS